MKSSKKPEKVMDRLSLGAHAKRTRVSARRRKWRIEIINENTLARVLSLRLTGIRARVALLAAIASIISLVVVVFTFTPVGRWIWGEKDLRVQYVDLSLKLDSINAVAQSRQAYLDNIVAILSDSIAIDSIIPREVPVVSDTLLDATEAERLFVERFEADNRFNLSVLSPIAAEGMIFESPVREAGRGGEISAVYRGTVIGRYVSPDGKFTLLIQHPNDFISAYTDLDNVYVSKGSKVIAGQRIAYTAEPLVFELWRGGVALDPTNYIPFPIPSSIDL